MSDLINIKDERFWDILFDEACVEGEQAERIEKELEQITVEPVRGKWIPCSERLPDLEDTVYLITEDSGNVVTALYYLYNDKPYWVEPYEQYATYTAAAWKPLPEPYREKVEE